MTSAASVSSLPAAPLIVIPARMASTRLPGKPLADLCGEPMIVHVWRRAIEADVGPVVVACAEPEIATSIQQAGGLALLTPPDLPSGSDRVWHAVQQFDPEGRHPVIINVQGDLPTLDPSLIRAALEPLHDEQVDIATLVAPVSDPEERTSPDVVKAITALPVSGQPSVARALAFTRATAPWGDGPLWHHIGLYAYRREALERFVSLPPSPLERREKLEQLRALEYGMRIDCVRVQTVPLGVDTSADLEKARSILNSAKP